MEDSSGKEISSSPEKTKAGEGEINEMEGECIKKFPGQLSRPLPTPGKYITLLRIMELLRYPGSALDSIPPGEKNNVFFVVNNYEALSEIRTGGLNIFHDDCGPWNPLKSSKVCTYMGNFDGIWKTVRLHDGKFCDKSVSTHPLDPQPDMKDILKVHRFYTVHKYGEDYRRRITILSGIGFRENRALVEYCGIKSVKQTSQVDDKEPREYVHQDSGGKIKRKSKGKLARHIHENKYLVPMDMYQMHSGGNDALQKMSKELISKVPFEKQIILSLLARSPGVQAVINRKGQPPCVILYSDQQLSDMKRNLECDNVLGVDCTHTFGNCYVTMTVYQNSRALHQDTNEPLLYMGPVYLHWDKEFLTYVSFFSHIMDKLDGMEPSIEVRLGNNVGLALFKALKFSFPTSVHILDGHHLRKNVNTELYDACDGKEKECSIIFKKIFGFKGLTSSPTLFIFRKRLSDLAPYFEEFPKLRTYFMKMKVILYEYFCEPLQKGVFPKLWGGCRDQVLSSLFQSVLHLTSCELPVLIKKICTINSLQMQYIKDKFE